MPAPSGLLRSRVRPLDNTSWLRHVDSAMFNDPLSLVILVGAPALAIGLYFLGSRCVAEASRPLVGQLGGPVIGAMVALYAAYLAFGGVQTQLALQQKLFNQNYASQVEARSTRLVDLRLAAIRLRMRIDADLHVPFIMEAFVLPAGADREKEHQKYKAMIAQVAADTSDLETASARSLLPDDIEKFAADFFDAIRDLNYVLEIALIDMSRGNNAVAPRSRGDISAKFERCQKTGTALKEALDRELANLQQQYKALVAGGK